MTWHKVALISDVKEGQGLAVKVPGRKKPVAVFCSEGEFFAIADECSHAYAPLSDSKVSNFIVTCRWHGAQFDIRSGKGLGPMAYTDIRTFPTRVNDGSIEIEL